jgi:hypothetical protein
MRERTVNDVVKTKWKAITVKWLDLGKACLESLVLYVYTSDIRYKKGLFCVNFLPVCQLGRLHDTVSKVNIRMAPHQRRECWEYIFAILGIESRLYR